MTQTPKPIDEARARRLRELAVKLDAAKDKREQLLEERAALIVEATEAGAGRRAIGRAAGLTPARVQEILTKRNRRN